MLGCAKRPAAPWVRDRMVRVRVRVRGRGRGRVSVRMREETRRAVGAC